MLTLSALTVAAVAQTTTGTPTDSGVPVLFPTGGGLDAHGFRLAAADSDVRDPFTFSRPGAMAAGDWYAGGLFEYAYRPLVWAVPEGDDAVALADVVALNLAGGYAPHERVRFEGSLPVFVASTGVTGPEGANIGDLRLGTLVALLRPQDAHGVGLAATGAVDLPTGDSDDWLGETGVAGQGGVAVTVERDVATFSAQMFARATPNNGADERPQPVVGEDAFGLGAGVNYLATPATSLGLETALTFPLSGTGMEALGIPAEVLATVRHARPDGAHFAAGVGVGVSGGAGASPFRLLVGGGWGTGAPGPVDTDGDGIVDGDDACATDPEIANGWKDDDGCPDLLPSLSVTATANGVERSDARVVAVRPDGTEIAGNGRVATTAMPGDRYRARATAGECLAGEGDVVVGEGEAHLEIPLEKLTGTVVLALTPADGKPIGDASVQYMVADPDCAPADSKAGGPVAIHQLGPGSHTVLVSVPNYAVWRGTVQVTAGGVTNVRVPLSPTQVVIEKDRIKILDKVYFETGLATIQSRSFPLLSEVANVILANDVGRVEVQGHTDDQGADDFNLKLSQDRASSVMRFLVDAGVPAERLAAVGYGEKVAIASNRNEAGRSQNRRVEFVILDDAGR
jgi:outer membrane protein OmpA-like peptidoglycan-associated protein